ncbi:MAG: alanine racemase, partial [Verrucomicrobiales bacterium]|nr:alanine racemase [Verrucomicrobiales bacterium]
MNADQPPDPTHRTWAEIDLSALLHNLGVVRSLHPDTAVMAVVKADAYGHGVPHVATALASAGVEFLGVANATEARRLARTGTDKRIYLLGPTAPGERPEIVHHRWVSCISSLEEAEHFDQLNAAAANPPLPVHLAVDTGMGRGGFLASSLPGIHPRLQALPHLHLEGIGSHLSSADENPGFTHQQIDLFNATLESLGGAETFTYRHLANSAGLLDYPLGHTNLVRPGLMLYGISPVPGHQQNLRPVLSLKASITLVRTLPPGHGISYGRTFVTDRPTTVATIGIGYGDGLPRNLPSQKTTVLIGGQPCPLLGRVTMDQIMVDVSHLTTPPPPGTAATIIGNTPGHTAT